MSMTWVCQSVSNQHFDTGANACQLALLQFQPSVLSCLRPRLYLLRHPSGAAL